MRRLAADQVLTIVAVRDDSIADLPESLGRLVSGHRGTVLRLRGLDEEDLRDLAAAMGIEGIGSGAARRLRYGTQGNPLHARALLEEFPPVAMGPRRSIAAVAEVVPPAGPGPLRVVARPTPAG